MVRAALGSCLPARPTDKDDSEMISHTATAESDLVRRIAVTLAALVAYRVGCWIPVPGVDVAAFSAASMHRISLTSVSVMALGIGPYLSALILVEVAKMAWPPLRAWGNDVRNARRLDGWVLAGALLLAALQAYGLAQAMLDVNGLVPKPGPAFHAGLAITLVGATAFVVWLASWITRHGIGSGLWILVAVPHLVAFGEAVVTQSAGVATGAVHLAAPLLVVATLAGAAAVLATLLKAAPALARPDEIVWTPVLGATFATWLFAAAYLLEWMVEPAAHSGFAPSLVSLYAPLPALAAGLALAALLRRQSLARGTGAPIAASARLLALAFVGIVLLEQMLVSLAGKPELPTPHAILMLAAVGVVVLEGLKARALGPETPQPSQNTSSDPI